MTEATRTSDCILTGSFLLSLTGPVRRRPVVEQIHMDNSNTQPTFGKSCRHECMVVAAAFELGLTSVDGNKNDGKLLMSIGTQNTLYLKCCTHPCIGIQYLLQIMQIDIYRIHSSLPD